jgi:hypothetical protein
VLAELDGHDDSAAAPPSGHRRGDVVALDGFEVTQVVQDVDHSVPLVAGKATVVRAYLTHPQPVSVRGELQVARAAGGPWQPVPGLGPADLDPSRSGTTAAALRSRRGHLAFSLNFLLPAELTVAGHLWIRTGEIQRVTGTALPSVAGLSARRVTFRRAAPLRLRLVRLRYRTGSPPRTHLPSGTDVTLIASWLRRAYPIARLDLTTTTVDATPAPEFEAAQVNAQLLSIRAVDVATGTDRRTHYYGMVADGGFFMRGRASDIPRSPRPGTVASGPTGPGSFGWDVDGSYGDWYGGHELGHTLGRFHAEFCGAAGGADYPFPDGQLSGPGRRFVGMDVGEPALGLPMRVLDGTTSHDVMTYCDHQWLSSFTYGGILERLVAEDALPSRTGSRPATPDPADAPELAGMDGRKAEEMRLIAAVNLTRTSGSISAVLPLPADGDSDASDRAVASAVTIRIRDAGGATLDQRPAAFVPSACEDPDEDVTGVVDMGLPTPAGAASIELLVDGEVVDSQPVGGEAAPPVPAGDHADADSVTGSIVLRWEAPGAPAGQRYIVQLRDEQSGAWQTVAIGLTEPVVSLSMDQVPGNEVTVRVFATTGSGTTLVRTDTVRVR